MEQTNTLKIVEDLDQEMRETRRLLLEASKRQDGTPAMNAQACANRMMAQKIGDWMLDLEIIRLDLENCVESKHSDSPAEGQIN